MNAPAKTNGNTKTAAAVTAIMSGHPPRPRSEATNIEQTRAVAEVQAMVTVAQARRRDVTRATEAMRQSCTMMALAERAFFKFPRGGQSVAGPSIHLARELARCWGNINYGVRELSRDDQAGQSEMLAFAWDLETNSRADTTFIVPHMRDKRGGAEPLTDMRDIYENNANNGARRLREMIFAVLPVWYREKAKQLCHETLQKGEGEQPLPLRIANVVAALGAMGISRERVEAKIGMSVEAMTPLDLANLIVATKSVQAGEVVAAEEFPAVTAQAVAAILQPPSPQSPTSQPEGGGESGKAAGNSPSEAGGPTAPQPKKNWTLSDNIVGQEKKLLTIYAMLDGKGDGPKVETPAEVDELWTAHEAFFDKLGATKKAEVNLRFGDRKIALAKAA